MCAHICMSDSDLFRISVFNSHELENAFRPVFDLVWAQEPESYPFRQPVDPKLLGIPVSSTVCMCNICKVVCEVLP